MPGAEPTRPPGRRTPVTRRRIGRLSFLAAIASLTSALLGVASVDPAAGGCVGPSLSVRNRLQPGSTAVIVGRDFFSKCDDTGSVGGCGAPRDPITGPGNPMDNIQVVVTQAGKTHLIGHPDANK